MSEFGRKSKGKKFEDKIALKIHEKLMELSEGYKKLDEEVGNVNTRIKRDATSGASNKTEGDIALGTAMKFFPFSMELKDWKSLTDIDINSIFKGKFQSLLKVWTEQCGPKAKMASEYHGTKLHPLQVFKGMRTLDMCMFSENDIKVFPEKRIHYLDLIICKFDDFLEIYLKEKNG